MIGPIIILGYSASMKDIDRALDSIRERAIRIAGMGGLEGDSGALADEILGLDRALVYGSPIPYRWRVARERREAERRVNIGT